MTRETGPKAGSPVHGDEDSTQSTTKPLFRWREALKSSGLAPTSRHVALALSLYMNMEGRDAFPGATRLAHDTGLSVRVVRKHLAALVKGAWLTLVEKGGRRGEVRRANSYCIPSTYPCTSVTRNAESPVTPAPPTPASDDTDPCSRVTPSLHRTLHSPSPRESSEYEGPIYASLGGGDSSTKEEIARRLHNHFQRTHRTKIAFNDCLELVVYARRTLDLADCVIDERVGRAIANDAGSIKYVKKGLATDTRSKGVRDRDSYRYPPSDGRDESGMYPQIAPGSAVPDRRARERAREAAAEYAE